MKFAMSYSGGKDSALALYRMVQAGHEPAALVVTINEEQGRSWFHGVSTDLLDVVSERVGIPLILCRCKPEEYQKAFEEGLAQAKRLGAEACVFGDIDDKGHKQWDEARCKTAGLNCILPLWNENREALTREGIAAGFRAAIKVVQLDILDGSFLGRTLDDNIIERIQKTGADVCGENGEYHTFVYDGPLFREAVPIRLNGIVKLGTHAAADFVLQR